MNQETEVIEAVEIFRDRAALAGNLKSDEHQVVSNEDGAIEITPVDHYFYSGFFWGITTAFAIGWHSVNLEFLISFSCYHHARCAN